MVCFNPSVGILFVHTGRVGVIDAGGKTFQSLGRDSVCSYQNSMHASGTASQVSIPRSGFCLFILYHERSQNRSHISFNPSVGILFVHTRVARTMGFRRETFQSLGRDSVCSYRIERKIEAGAVVFQSLGRDSVCSYLPRPSL